MLERAVATITKSDLDVGGVPVDTPHAAPLPLNSQLLCFDDDLAGEVTRIKNRLRGLLTRIHPPLERVMGPPPASPGRPVSFERHGCPAQLRKAGKRRLISLPRPRAPRIAERLVADIFDALDEQSVVVPGTDAAVLTVPSLTDS